MSEHLTVILLTYQRTEYAVRTIQAVNAHLRYPNWSWYIADDGSEVEHMHACWTAARVSGQEVLGHSARLSYGRNANRALAAAWEKGELVLMLEDDWELTRPFDIWQYAAAIMENAEIGMVRTGYLNADVDATLRGYGGQLYLSLHDLQSRQHSSFAFAGHPAVVHRRFYTGYGLYPEGWQPGETELKMCWQVSERLSLTRAGGSILWPMGLGERGPWAHIGTAQSYVWNGGVSLEIPSTEA